MSTRPENPVAPTSARTAKPCGPGRRCYGQACRGDVREPNRANGIIPFATAREARTNSAPGRARHKPSDHRAGKAVCWASPVCCCAVSCVCLLRSRPRVPPAPGLPCALLAERVERSSKARAIRPRGREGVSATRMRIGRATSLPHTPSLRGALATKQSRISPRRDSGLLRFARNDDVERQGRPTPLSCSGRSAALQRVPRCSLSGTRE
jgi:hypothetical protein